MCCVAISYNRQNKTFVIEEIKSTINDSWLQMQSGNKTMQYINTLSCEYAVNEHYISQRMASFKFGFIALIWTFIIYEFWFYN